MHLTFLCLNLWQGGNLLDDAIGWIKRENPDVIAMQEVYDGRDPSWERKFRSMDELRKALGYPHEAFASAFLERTAFGKVEQGNAVFSRYPITGTETVFYDVPYGEREDIPEYYEHTPRNLQRVTLNADGTEINVFNTQGVWGTDGRDSARRIEMGRVIAESVRGKKNVILTGDFNVNPDTESIAQVERELTNVFAGELVSTFNMRHKTNPAFASAVVDMVFVSPEIEILEKSCPDVNVSDHRPLLVTLKIPDAS